MDWGAVRAKKPGKWAVVLPCNTACVVRTLIRLELW